VKGNTFLLAVKGKKTGSSPALIGQRVKNTPVKPGDWVSQSVFSPPKRGQHNQRQSNKYCYGEAPQTEDEFRYGVGHGHFSFWLEEISGESPGVKTFSALVPDHTLTF